MSDQSLQVISSVFAKLLSGATISLTDVQAVLFQNIQLPAGFLSSDDFKQILNCFNFNGDNTVDMADFDFLITHLSDLSVFLKVTRIATLAITKFAQIKNFKLTSDQALDLVIRTILYCILYIAVSSSGPFKTWALQTNSTGQKNSDLLLNLLSDLVLYLKTQDTVAADVTQAVQFFETKLGCMCVSPPDSASAAKMIQAKVEMNSLMSQVQKETQVYQLTKTVNAMQVAAAAAAQVVAPAQVTAPVV